MSRARCDRYDSNAGTLLQMHVCMEMANTFEAQGKIDDAALHRASAIRHLQTLSTQFQY